MVGFYPFNGNANDESGFGNHGTVNGTALTTDTKNIPNIAYQFDGVDDTIQFSNTFQFNSVGDASVCLILYPTSTSHNTILWGSGSQADVNHFNAYLFHNPNDGTFNVDYRNPSGPLHLGPFGSNSSIYNAWHYVSVTRSGNTYKIYVDGLLESTKSDSNPNLPTSTVWILSGRSGFLYKGKIDDIRFYNREISSSEVLALSGLPTPMPTGVPSCQPSSGPSGDPSGQPSGQPSRQPVAAPTAQPSGRPSVRQTSLPSRQPSALSSGLPSGQPSGAPSAQPSGQPTGQPTGAPSWKSWIGLFIVAVMLILTHRYVKDNTLLRSNIIAISFLVTHCGAAVLQNLSVSYYIYVFVQLLITAI